MTEFELPIQMRPAVYGAKKWLPGTLILYRDRLVHVGSRVITRCAIGGAMVVFALSFGLTHSGPGALGGLIGAGGGAAIGNAIAKRRAPGKAAAGGELVTVIPLDSITRVERRKASRLGGWRLFVSTSSQVEYAFRAKVDEWSRDLANVLAARGHMLKPTATGLTVMSGSQTPAP